MKNLEIKNITLIDNPETKEAEKIYSNKSRLYCWIFIVPLIISVCTISNKFPVLAFCIGFAILTIINFLIYKKVMQPYKKLLKLAEKNDLIRHEEKIRHKERARLQEDDNVTYTKKDIDKTMRRLNK